MRIFHKHEFKRTNNQLWCSCGEVKELTPKKCNHKWGVHKEELIKNIAGNKQNIQTLICENCGEIKFINTTTGEFVSEDITIKYDIKQ